MLYSKKKFTNEYVLCKLCLCDQNSILVTSGEREYQDDLVTV
jgi:hypothetical protein